MHKVHRQMRLPSLLLMRGLAPLTLGFLVGCGGDPEDSISLVRVSGTITVNGKSLSNARISFVPDPGNKEKTAGGDTTGPEGNYMAQFRGRNGLAPGKYKVLVESTPSEALSASASEAFENDPFMAAEASRTANAAKRSKKQEVKTEFEATVDDKPTVIDKDLKATSSAAASASASASK